MSPGRQPSRAGSKDNARQTARRRREEQERKARQRRVLLVALAVLVVVIAGVAIVALIANPGSTSSPGQIRPAVATERGAIVADASGVATPPADNPDWPHLGGGPVVVSVYSDYRCSYCALFEVSNSETLNQLRLAGEIVVAYHPVSILDRYAQGTQFSTRAAAAAFHVADRAPEAFLAFNQALFLHQPDGETPGLTDAELAGLAREAGAPDAVVNDIATGNTPREWVQIATERASQDLSGALSTPTILLNRTPLDTTVHDWRQPGVLEQAIADARG